MCLLSRCHHGEATYFLSTWFLSTFSLSWWLGDSHIEFTLLTRRWVRTSECHCCQFFIITAAVPASEVEAVVRSPTNMAAADNAAVDFNKMTSLDRPAACGHVRWGRCASQSMASNTSAVVIGRKKLREYLIQVNIYNIAPSTLPAFFWILSIFGKCWLVTVKMIDSFQSQNLFCYHCALCIVVGLLHRNSAVYADFICRFPASSVQWTHGCTYIWSLCQFLLFGG